MPRTRRHIAGFPDLHVTSQLKLNCTAIDHDVAVFEPILLPRLSIDLHRLHVIAVLIVEVVGRDTKSLVAVDGHIDIREPRRLKQIHWLRDDRPQTQHLPQEPRVQCPGVAVARNTIVGIMETERTSACCVLHWGVISDYAQLICKYSRLCDALVLLVDVIVLVWSCEVRFIARLSVSDNSHEPTEAQCMLTQCS